MLKPQTGIDREVGPGVPVVLKEPRKILVLIGKVGVDVQPSGIGKTQKERGKRTTFRDAGRGGACPNPVVIEGGRSHMPGW